MKLTFKAIARAAGYRVTTTWTKPHVGAFKGTVGEYYIFKDRTSDHDSMQEGLFYKSAEEAYQGCCVFHGLVEFEEGDE